MADDTSPFSWLQSTPDTPPTPDSVGDGFSWLSSGTGTKKKDDDDPPPQPDAPKKKKRKKGDPIPLIKTAGDDDTSDDNKSPPDDFQQWLKTHPEDAVDLTKPPRPPTYMRSPLPTANDVLPPGDPKGVPNWKMMTVPQLQSTQFGPASSLVTEAESGNKNIRQIVDGKPVGKASGLFQIEDATWRDYAPSVGVNLERWPVAKDAPPQVQAAVAAIIPLKRWTAGFTAVKGAYPWANGNITLGQADTIAQNQMPQRYIMAQDRESSEWGRPPEINFGPGYMPTTPQDVHPIMGLAGAVLRFLSSVVAIPTQLMLGSYTGYIRAKSNGQLLDMMHHQGNWKDAIAEVKFRQQEELVDIASVQAAYQDNPQALVEGYTQIANKYGDGVLRDIAGNPDAVDRLMKARDRYFQNVSKLDAQNAKSEDEKIRTQDYTQNTQSQIAAREANLALRRQQMEQSRDLRQQQIDIARQRAAKGAASNPYTSDGGNGPGGVPTQQPRDDGDTGGDSSTTDTPEDTIPPPPPVEEATPASSSQRGDDGEESRAEPAPGTKPATQVAQATPAPAAKPAASQQQVAQARPARAPGTQVAAADAPVTDATPDRTIQQDWGPPLEEETPDKKADEEPKMGPAMKYLNPSGRQLALDSLMDPEALKDVPLGHRAPIVAARTELQRQLDGILRSARKGDIKGNDITDAVRNVYEPLGDTLQSVVDAKRVVPGSGFGGGGGSMSSFWSNVSDLATIVKPGWNPNNVMASRQFMDPNARTQFTLRRAGTMAKTAVNVLKDLNAIKDDPKSFIQRMTEAITSRGLKGEPEYTTLYNDWQAFVQEDQAVRSGAASVTETEEQIKTVFTSLAPGSKSQIRAAVIHNIQTAGEAIRLMHDLWNQYGVASNGKPDPMYGDHPDVDDAIEAFDRMDQNTGLITGPVPAMLRAAIPQDDAGFSTRKLP